jgi:hypothetical protein
MQCAIPVFDGLLPEPHNTRVLKLLFNLAHWHGLAKLRMHTEPTLDMLSQATTSLGSRFRDFQEKTCTMFQTRELERERAARQRRQGKRQGKHAVNHGGRPVFATSNARISSEGTGEPTNITNHTTGPTPAHTDSRESADATNPISESAPAAPSEGPRKPKHLNLKTYTYHALGDYVKTISYFGTMDSYSTQSVSFDWICSLGCSPSVDIRVNLSIEHLRHASLEPVAD